MSSNNKCSCKHAKSSHRAVTTIDYLGRRTDSIGSCRCCSCKGYSGQRPPRPTYEQRLLRARQEAEAAAELRRLERERQVLLDRRLALLANDGLPDAGWCDGSDPDAVDPVPVSVRYCPRMPDYCDPSSGTSRGRGRAPLWVTAALLAAATLGGDDG